MDTYPFIDKLVSRAAEVTGVAPQRITGKRKHPHLVRLRWAVMLVARERNLPLEMIAAGLGREDHTTVIHGLRRARELQDMPGFRSLVEDIRGSAAQ